MQCDSGCFDTHLGSVVSIVYLTDEELSQSSNVCLSCLCSALSSDIPCSPSKALEMRLLVSVTVLLTVWDAPGHRMRSRSERCCAYLIVNALLLPALLCLLQPFPSSQHCTHNLAFFVLSCSRLVRQYVRHSNSCYDLLFQIFESPQSILQ